MQTHQTHPDVLARMEMLKKLHELAAERRAQASLNERLASRSEPTKARKLATDAAGDS